MLIPLCSAATTRVSFSHQETFPWSDARNVVKNPYTYDVEWDLTITGTVTFPVDIDAYNDGTMDPDTDNNVNYKLTTPEKEGEVTFTVIGSIDITYHGTIKDRHAYKDVEKTIPLPVTTPLDEKEIPLGEIPIGPIEIPPAPPVYIILKPTLHLNSSIVANASVEGPATISPSNLEWLSDGDVEIITVHSSSGAQKDDSIILTIKDVNYSWDSYIVVGLYFSLTPSDGIHVADSPDLRYQTHNILSDENVTVPFNIPEFPTIIALVIVFTSVTAILTFAKRRFK